MLVRLPCCVSSSSEVGMWIENGNWKEGLTRVWDPTVSIVCEREQAHEPCDPSSQGILRDEGKFPQSKGSCSKAWVNILLA